MNLKNILEELCNHYPIDIISAEFLRDGGCTAYIVYSKTDKYLLKVIGGAFSDTIRQSIDIMVYLSKNAFPVPRIINTEKGKPYIFIIDNDSEYIAVLYEFIVGEEPNIDEKAEEIGELTGRLHLIMQNYAGSLTVRGKQFFINRYISILKLKNYFEKKTVQYAALGSQLWETVKDLPQGYCHGDLHRGLLISSLDGSLTGVSNIPGSSVYEKYSML